MLLERAGWCWELVDGDSFLVGSAYAGDVPVQKVSVGIRVGTTPDAVKDCLTRAADADLMPTPLTFTFELWRFSSSATGVTTGDGAAHASETRREARIEYFMLTVL